MSNARKLASRDPALAAALGIIGDDFGHEESVDLETADFGVDPYAMLAPFGADWGADWGDDTAAPTAKVAPAPAQMAALWNQQMQKNAITQQRQRILNPNAGSDVKVERYSFTLNQVITALATAQSFNMSGSPDVKTRPQRVIFNAPAPGFVYITDIKVANTSVLIGGGNSEDVYSYSAVAQNSMLDLPTIQPQNKVQVPGQYSGYVPPGYSPGNQYLLTATFHGPSEISA